jgi:hypothetical protein
MTLRTPGKLQEVLFEYAMGNSIKKALATIGGRSEQSVANWRRASRKNPEAWLVKWPPDQTGTLIPFHQAFDVSRQWGRLAAQSELERDLRTRLYERQNRTGTGYPKPKPETVFTPAEWEPPERIGRGGPPPPPPQTLADHPRAYQSPNADLRPQQPQSFRAVEINRAGNGKSEPPSDGRFSMSRAMGDHIEVSRAEARSGKPRVTQFGVVRD